MGSEQDSQYTWSSPVGYWNSMSDTRAYDDAGQPMYAYRDPNAEYTFPDASRNPDMHSVQSPIHEVARPPAKARRTSPVGGVRDQGPRAPSNPPPGVTECASCGTTASPEWRRGASGKKDLCNAYVCQYCTLHLDLMPMHSCGLRYSRQRAKSQGAAPPRRKKASITDEGLTPPPLPAVRRGSAPDISMPGPSYALYAASTASSQTPSPSPPAHIINFGHYNAYGSSPGGMHYTPALASSQDYAAAAYYTPPPHTLPRTSDAGPNYSQAQRYNESASSSMAHAYASGFPPPASYERIRHETHAA
jgi:hypothetical protein